MGNFISFMTLKIEHEYYGSSVYKHMQLTPTPETTILMRRRGLILTDRPQEYMIVTNSSSPGFEEADVLEFQLRTLDPDFLLFTELDKYSPEYLNKVTLGDVPNLYLSYELQTTNERKRQQELCRIVIKPTNKMLTCANENRTVNYTLRFQSSSYRWEYFFIDRNANNEDVRHLVLQDPEGRISFEKSVKVDNSRYGKQVYRIVSTTAIKNKEYMDHKLSLFEEYPGTSQPTKMISRFIPNPEPGKFRSDEKDIIRQFSYI